MLNKKGNTFMWVIVILFIISITLVSYSKVVLTNYKVSLSIYRQNRASDYSYAISEFCKYYFKTNEESISYLIDSMEIGSSVEIYPNGILIGEKNVLEGFSTNSISLMRDSFGTLTILVECNYLSAKERLSFAIIGMNPMVYGELNKIKN